MQPYLILNLSTLESYLWEAANILRGSPVDRTDWKRYILPHLFFKRICDVWDEEYLEAVEIYGEDFADKHRFRALQYLVLKQDQAACKWIAIIGKTVPFDSQGD